MGLQDFSFIRRLKVECYSCYIHNGSQFLFAKLRFHRGASFQSHRLQDAFTSVTPFEPKANIKGFLPLVFTAQLRHCCIINGSNYRCYCVPPPTLPWRRSPAVSSYQGGNCTVSIFFFSQSLSLSVALHWVHNPELPLNFACRAAYSSQGLCITCLRSLVQFGASISRTLRWICSGSGHSADLSLFVLCLNVNISWNTEQAQERLQTWPLISNVHAWAKKMH